MEPKILRHLNSVLRVQLAAVQQHFIHVLTLKAWGDEETAKEISGIDEVDLPNALRIVDLIVSSGGCPKLCRDRRSLAEHLPTPGSTYKAIFAAESRLEGKLVGALQAARAALTKIETQNAANLILHPLSLRGRYEKWLQRQSATGPGSNGPAQPLSGRATSSLDALFAHLMVMIEQGLIHSFLHWHHGERILAEAAWSVSGAAMMQATDVTNRLALRHCAPCPAAAVASKSVPLPRVGRTPEEALQFDQALAERCAAAAERAMGDLGGTEFEAVCRHGAEYFQALSRRQPNLDHPEFNNPCRGFERVLRKYVWEPGTRDRASA